MHDLWKWLRMSQFVKTVKSERLGCGANGSRILDNNVKHVCKMTTVQCSYHKFLQRLRHWWRPNMMKTLRNRKSWTDEYAPGTKTYSQRYIRSSMQALMNWNDDCRVERLREFWMWGRAHVLWTVNFFATDICRISQISWHLVLFHDQNLNLDLSAQMVYPVTHLYFLQVRFDSSVPRRESYPELEGSN